MKVSEIAKELDLRLITSEGYDDRPVTGCYIGDLLSWVMGRAQEGDMWITIMSNINIAAVASLADVSCVVLAEGVSPDAGVKEKCDMQGIILLGSDKTAYDIAAAYTRLTEKS